MRPSGRAVSTIRIYLDDLTWYNASLLMLTRGENNELMVTFVANRQTHAVPAMRVRKVEVLS